jgi:hypothetical protein
MVKSDKFSEFDAYLEEQRPGFKRSQAEIEKTGTEAALNRCRELACEIQSRLLNRKAGHFGNVLSLADLQVSLEEPSPVSARLPLCTEQCMWPTHTEPSGSLLSPTSAAGPPRGFGGGGATSPPCGTRAKNSMLCSMSIAAFSVGLNMSSIPGDEAAVWGAVLELKTESRAPEERSYHHFWPNF